MVKGLKLGAGGENSSSSISIPAQVWPTLQPVLFLVPAHFAQGSQESVCRGS